MSARLFTFWTFYRLSLFLALLASAVASTAAAATFRFADVNEKSLGLWEGEQPVFVYNHGAISKPGVSGDRGRTTYFHPIYGLEAEVLTDDFPKDHPYHRGLFWGWPHIRIGNDEFGLWALKGIEQRFERWIARECDTTGAVLALENGWHVGNQKSAQERLRLRVHPVTPEGRVIDVELEWSPIGKPITLQGAEGKSYGGFTFRFGPRTDTVITTPLGQGNEDLLMTRLHWADFSARFDGRSAFSGAAVLIAPDHPDYPPEWMTRHYGLLCVGWPGVKAKTFQPGDTVRLRYRLWIHRGAPDVKTVQKVYEQFQHSHETRKQLQ